MGRKRVLLAAVMTVVVGAIILISCSSKETLNDGMFRANPRPKSPESKAIGEKEVAILEELKPIFFEYNKAELTAESRKTLEENAAWLKKNPKVEVQIEGHCDERGSREFNYKLGDKRAETAKKQMVALGISSDRVGTTSYGALSGQNEKTWPRHRQAVFVLIYPKQAE